MNLRRLQGHRAESETTFSQMDTELRLRSRESPSISRSRAAMPGFDAEMPIDRYLDGDILENHPLFKSQEQAAIEETMDGEPARS